MTVDILCSSKIEYRSCKTGFLLFYCFTNIIRINSDVKSLNCQTVSSSYRTVSVNVSGKLSLFVKSCFLNGYFKSKRSISEVYFAVLVSIWLASPLRTLTFVSVSVSGVLVSVVVSVVVAVSVLVSTLVSVVTSSL